MREDFSNIEYIHLSSKSFRARIDGNGFSVGTESRMQIHPENSLAGGRFQFCERNKFLSRQVIKKQVLIAVDHIGVGEQPRGSDVRVVAVIRGLPQHFDRPSGAVVLEQIVSRNLRAALRPHMRTPIEDGVIILPGMMAGVVIEKLYIAAVW